MKKLVLSLLAAAAVAPAFAQPGLADGWLLYGSGSYSSSRGESTVGNVQSDFPSIRQLSVSPGLGYQFTERWAVGAFLELDGRKTDFPDRAPGTTESVRTRNLVVGPFIRYTMPMGDRFYWFSQADFGYISGKSRTVINGTPDTEREVDFNGVRGRFFPSVGMSFSRTMSVAFNIGGIQYLYNRVDPGANIEEKSSNFNINFGQVVGFTVQKYFGGRRYGYGQRGPMDETRRLDTSDDEEDDDDRRRRRRGRENDDE